MVQINAKPQQELDKIQTVITHHLLPDILYSASNLSETVHHHPMLGLSRTFVKDSTHNQ